MFREVGHVSEQWLLRCGDVTLYADTGEHVALILRTLRIDEPRWRHTLARYAARGSPPPRTMAAKLDALRDAYAEATPPGESAVPERTADRCPACGETCLVPSYARMLADAPTHSFAYARCRHCGHGILLDGHVPRDAYAAPAYYQTQTAGGVGYADYAREREYREGKGRRLFEDVLRQLDAPCDTVLEVGSGFGYTRAAAESLGIRTLGVDLNPFAAAAARELYGMATFVGTLDDGLTAGEIERGTWDLVLYNFVLEHVADPEAELRIAASALRPGGALVLVVPSMDAREVEVFGGSYRSFRTDHLHVFSRGSIALFLERSGFTVGAITTTCNAHLFRGFLEEAELRELYERGEGPDMTVIATRR